MMGSKLMLQRRLPLMLCTLKKPALHAATHLPAGCCFAQALPGSAEQRCPGGYRYQKLLGCAVEPCRFRVLRDDDVHGWLGASPDGLVASLTTQGAHPRASGAEGPSLGTRLR